MDLSDGMPKEADEVYHIIGKDWWAAWKAYVEFESE